MKKKLLVIDDQEMFRQQIVNGVKNLKLESSFEVIEAINGIDACDKFTENDIDIMTIDLNMPEMTGIEFLECLDRDLPEKLHSTLKFIITAEGVDADLKASTKKFNIKSWILKPIDVEKFLKMVHNFYEEE
jgi:DNA-binding NarL/FixJ family response regulator